jgi:fructose-1,6-bisphosphatase II
MLRLPKQNYHDIERIIEFDFVRATEAAALNSLRWLGCGDKEKLTAPPAMRCAECSI